MQVSTDVIGNEAQPLPLSWEETRCWARSKLHAAGAVVAGFAAFLGLAGLVEYALYQAVQNWTVGGVGISAFGYF